MPRTRGNKLTQKPRQTRRKQSKSAKKPTSIKKSNKLVKKSRNTIVKDIFTITQKNAIKNYKKYEKLVEKIEKYGQTVRPRSFPPVPPTGREIRRLEEKLKTIHEYDKIFRRYQRSVQGFNEKYGQGVAMPDPHDTLNRRTLETLKERYEKWKKWRRNFVRKIPKEDDTAFKNMIDWIRTVKAQFRPNPWTGEYSKNDEMYIEHCNDLINRFEGLRFGMGSREERITMFNYILLKWPVLVKLMNEFIYNSEQPVRERAWKNIIRTLSGNDLVMDFEGGAPEDYEYE